MAMRSVSGAALGVVLSLVALVAVLGFALSTMSLSRLFFSSNAEVQREAEEAARALMQVALRQTLSQPAYAPKRLEVKSGRATAIACFAPKDDLGRPAPVPTSLNNLVGETGQECSDGRFVPIGMVRLFIESRCQKYVARYESFLHSPALPYAIAACGGIRSDGPLVIASLQAQGVHKLETVLEDPLGFGLPADILSNSSSQRAVEFRGVPTTIFGDLRCCGKASLTAANLRLAGEVWEGAPAYPLPPVPDFQQLDPRLHGHTVQLIHTETLSEVVDLVDWVREGDLTVTDLVKLQGNRLYVTGDLTIHGQARGFGTIVVGGQLHFAGQNQTRPEKAGEDTDDDDVTSQITSDKLAVYARESIILVGNSVHTSFFRGLLLCAGKIHAEKISVIGSLVAVGAETVDTRVELSDCLLVQDLLLPANPVLHLLSDKGVDEWTPGHLTVEHADKDNLKFVWLDQNGVSHPFDLKVRDPNAAEKNEIEAAGALISPGNEAPYLESDDRYKNFGGFVADANQSPWQWIFNHARWIYHQKESVQEFAPASFYKVNEMLRPAYFHKVS